MKNTIIIILLSLSAFSYAQDKSKSAIITETLNVSGNCDMCKKRIENAADIKGVKFFEWNEKTHVAKVIFNSEKTNLDAIEKAIAAKGYDTPHHKGNDEAYTNLPDCCHYRTKECTEKK